MKKIVFLLLLQLSFISVFAQDDEEISLFNSKGKPIHILTQKMMI